MTNAFSGVEAMSSRALPMRRGNNLKRFDDFQLNAKARLFYTCHIRSIAVQGYLAHKKQHPPAHKKQNPPRTVQLDYG